MDDRARLPRNRTTAAPFFEEALTQAFIDRSSEETVPIEGERRAALESLQLA